jgi:protein-S-isoprenylcysteine O-methyltransferase Ste14
MTRLPSLGPRGEGWVVLQFLLLAGLAVAGLLGPGWSGTIRTVTSVLGLALLAAGGLLAVRGLIDLRHALTPLPYPREDADLVDSGAYRLVRHPIYGGIVLGAAGWALLTASIAAVVLAVVVGAFFDLKSRREEVWLVFRHAGYQAYRQRTKRLVPWLY